MVKGLVIDTDLNICHRSTYNRVASRYAVVNAEMPPAVLASAEDFLGLMSDGARVLEMGCGHGRDAAWFEVHGLSVVSGDLSLGMLWQAAKVVSGPVVQMDMRRLPFETGSFDGVWSNAAVIHLPRFSVPGVLSEVWRALRPGGWFFVSIQVGADEVWEERSYGEDVGRFFSRHTPSAFAELISAAGFSVRELDEDRSAPNRLWAHFLAQRV